MNQPPPDSTRVRFHVSQESSTTLQSRYASSTANEIPGTSFPYPPRPSGSGSGSDEGVWWKSHQTLLTIFSLILGGVVGFFTSQWAVKDAISALQTNLSIVTERVSFLSSRMVDINEATSSLSKIQRDLAVIETKVNQMERQNERQTPAK